MATLRGAKTLEMISRVKDKKPDVFSACETELPVGGAPNIPGYSVMVPTVSVSTRVRNLLYIRKDLHGEQVPAPCDIPIVAAKVGNEVIVGIYREFSQIGAKETIRGNALECEEFDHIEAYIRSIAEKYKTFHVVGDINLDVSREGDKEYYKKALLSRWNNLMTELGLVWAETGPTYKSFGRHQGQHRISTIDLIYSRGREMKATVLPDGTSDHWPVLAEAKNASKSALPKRVSRQDRNWRNINTSALNNFFSEYDWSQVMSATEVDTAVSHLTTALKAGIDIAVPVRSYHTPNLGVRLKKDTRAVMRARDLAKKKGSLNYKVLRNRALSMIRRDYVSHNVDRIKRGGPSTAWKVADEVRGKEKTSDLPLPKECMSEQEAADKMNEFFREKVLNLRSRMNSKPSEKVTPMTGNTFSFNCVGVATLRRALKELKPKVSYGLDGVPITVIKLAFENLALPLVHTTNLILSSGVWPALWKEAQVVPGLKANKPSDELSSYRPISGLCSVSKLVEKVIYNQMLVFINERGIIPKHQHGFRAGHSTDTALANIFAKVASALDKKHKVTLLAFDFSSAFDCMSKEVLESKLGWMEPSARSLLMNYMSERSQRVIFNSATSKALKINYGMPQGSILAPLMFIILTGDLPHKISENVNPKTASEACLYADDTSAYISSRSWEENEMAQRAMTESLLDYSCTNELSLNTSKTQKLNIGGNASAEDINILGVSLDKDGGFATHHKNIHKDIRKRLGMVRNLACHMPRGKLLSEISKSLIIGRVQCNAFLTRPARLAPVQPSARGSTEVLLNDMSRVLIGVTRADRLKTEELLDRAQIPSLNQIVVRQSALNAWRSVHEGAMSELLVPYDTRTRGAEENLRRPVSQRCTASSNMALVWNSAPELRQAKSLQEARRVARKIGESARHL